MSALMAVAPEDTANWRAIGPACQGLRDGLLAYPAVESILEFLVPVLATPNRGLILAGLLALNAGRADEASALLQTVGPESSIESYLVGVGLARAAKNSDDRQAEMSALRAAYTALGESTTREFAESHEIFAKPATLAGIGVEIAELMRQNEA